MWNVVSERKNLRSYKWFRNTGKFIGHLNGFCVVVNHQETKRSTQLTAKMQYDGTNCHKVEECRNIFLSKFTNGIDSKPAFFHGFLSDGCRAIGQEVSQCQYETDPFTKKKGISLQRGINCRERHGGKMVYWVPTTTSRIIVKHPTLGILEDTRGYIRSHIAVLQQCSWISKYRR